MKLQFRGQCKQASIDFFFYVWLFFLLAGMLIYYRRRGPVKSEEQLLDEMRKG